MDFLHKRAEFLKVKDHFVLKGIGPIFLSHVDNFYRVFMPLKA